MSRVSPHRSCPLVGSQEFLNPQKIGIGGASRDRTDDLIVANDALSQLSYSPTSGVGFILTKRVGSHACVWGSSLPSCHVDHCGPEVFHKFPHTLNRDTLIVAVHAARILVGLGNPD